MKPITDKAEVSIDFPDKAYMGAFGRDSGFDVRAQDDDVALRLVRSGEQKRVVELHIHYYLLADVLSEMAASISAREPIDEAHRKPLVKAVKALQAALARR